MRSERPQLPVLLAAMAALWALAVCLAALFGLGARLPAGDGDAVAPQPLPGLPQPLPERLGSLDDYPQVAARPLFNEGRRPQPYFIAGGEQVASAGLRLTGVMLTPQANIATLSGDGGLSIRLHQGGAAVQGWQLLELSPRQATVLGPDGTQVLMLAVYDGSADAPVSAPGSVPPAGAPASAPRAGGAEGSKAGAAVPAAATPAAAAPPRPEPAAAINANANTPSAAQMQAIRERIQARRLQMQQNNNGQNPGQNR